MTRTTFLVRVAFASVLMAASACGGPSCTDYGRIVNDEERRARLLEWADAHVFSREFSEGDFNMGLLVGPGRSGAFSRDTFASHVPGFIVGYEIRPLGQDRRRPEGLFLGRSSFSGVIVSRGEMNALLLETGFAEGGFEATADRLGAICHDERNM